MKNILNYKNLNLESLIKIHEVTFRINRKLKVYYIFISQEHSISLNEIFIYKNLEKNFFHKAEIENFLKESLGLLKWLNEKSFYLSEFSYENIYCSINPLSNKMNISFKFELLPKFEKNLIKKIGKNIDLASLSRRNIISICSIIISLITMIEYDELKKIQSSKILINFLKNAKELSESLFCFLQIIFEDNLMGYDIEQTFNFFQCLQNNNLKNKKQKTFQSKSYKPQKNKINYLYYIENDFIYLYIEADNKNQGFRLLSDKFEPIKIQAHYLDEKNNLHFLFYYNNNSEYCNYSKISLEKSMINEDNIRTIREFFKLIFSKNKMKNTIDKVFPELVENKISFNQLKNYVDLNSTDRKNQNFFIEIQAILKIMLCEDNDELFLDKKCLFQLFDLVNNSTNIFPLKIKTIITFEKFYFPGEIMKLNDELYFFGGNLKKFPSSFFFKLKNDNVLEKMTDIPFATKTNYVFPDNQKENIFWISFLKKNLQIYKYNLENAIWSTIDLKKQIKFDSISLLIRIPERMRIILISNNFNCYIDLEKCEVIQLEIENIFIFKELQTNFNFQIYKNSIKFIKFDGRLKILALNDILMNKWTNHYYCCSLPLRDINFPISMDKSLEKTNRKTPIILEEKPIVSIISVLSSFPFSEISLGTLFFKDEEIFTILSRKIDREIENFDDVFEGCKLMIHLKHINLLKMKDFYIISMEILFLYKGFYEDLCILQERNKKNQQFPTKIEMFLLLFHTVSAIEYLKSNKMFFFEINPKNILFQKQNFIYKLINFEYENNISRNQFYFENRNLFPYLPPMPHFNELQKEEEEKSASKINLNCLNLDIHKANIYSLGLICISYALNENILQYNNYNDIEKIPEIVKTIKYPKELIEILLNMINIDEDMRWDSSNILQRLNELKPVFIKKIGFKSLNLKKTINETNILFLEENSLLKYSQINVELKKYAIFFDDESPFIFSQLYGNCFDQKSNTIFIFYFAQKCLEFFQGRFENHQIRFKKMEKPLFLENGNQILEINQLALDGFLYILGYKYKTSLGVSSSKHFFCFDVMLNKWYNYMPIPDNIDDYFPFSHNMKLFLLGSYKKKIKLLIYDIYKHLWEIKKLKNSNTLKRNNGEKDFLRDIYSGFYTINLEYPLISLYEIGLENIYLLDLEKFKVKKKKVILIIDEKGENNFSKPDSFLQKSKFFYKSFNQIEKNVFSLSLWFNENTEEIFCKKKCL